MTKTNTRISCHKKQGPSTTKPCQQTRCTWCFRLRTHADHLTRPTYVLASLLNITYTTIKCDNLSPVFASCQGCKQLVRSVQDLFPSGDIAVQYHEQQPHPNRTWLTAFEKWITAPMKRLPFITSMTLVPLRWNQGIDTNDEDQDHTINFITNCNMKNNITDHGIKPR